MSATTQSESSPWRPGIQVKGETFKESEEVCKEKPQIKIMNEKHVSMETTEDSSSKPIIKSVGNIHVSKETESSDIVVKSHIKSSSDMHATKQSTEEREVNFPKMKRSGEMDSLKESEPMEWKIKKASVFGHVSQLSNQEFTISAPRLKRPEKLFALEESDLRDFSIRPKIHINKKRHANVMSDPALPQKPHIKMSDNRSSTLESDYVDMDEIRRQKFRKINLYGHASDSTVQKLLYGGEVDEMYYPKKSDKEDSTALQTSKDDFVQFWLDEEDNVEPYQDDFKVLDEKPMTDLLATRMYTPYGSLGDYGISLNSDVDLYKYIPLPALLKHSITTPLMAQISLVNDCVINYMTTEMQIDQHFLALHRYLFMADGDFAQILSDILLEKLASNPKIQELLNPVFLNGALTKSLQLSMHTDDQYADNLSFAVRYIPNVLQQNVHDTLDCLELRYKVKWPVNIIITDKCITKYSKVFSFMLQLKRVVWVLKDVWHKLKRDALVHKVGSSSQFRQLQLYRQEMQHFVKVMQGYITNQIIHVAWQELQEALANDVKNLDDLHRVHTDYLDRAIFRCLLNKKAAPLMKIIQDIFCLILKFRTQLINATWLQSADAGEMTNTAFSSLQTSYKAFREYSCFLFKVVNKLAIRGYQPHLQELLLRLNFNDYYKDK
ncbi:hypothetical protein KUTeg_000285 [Tegillarca granosa]|uniref:Gamma-tubulin complex component n=1 Tax=Tegillarca granosa TaxID=220873 RepID=A0ABQ9FX43_TEGGR|nr:hypothetical protein KUTeg_000285 [Tegillarca granosa]